MGSVISCLEEETGRECLETFRRCLDHECASLVEYDDFDREFMKEQGETERHSGAHDISGIAKDWQEGEPAFRLFLDGSRCTYKIADIPIGTQIFPIITGQVGVGVCKRDNRSLSPCDLYLRTVMAFPDKLDADGKNDKQHRAFLADLAAKLNAAVEASGRKKFIDMLLLYPTKKDDNFEDKGIARIQEYMVELEKEMMDSLVKQNHSNNRSWLIKDGSLEYSCIADKNDRFAFNRIRSNYKRVVGVSKSFNPELAKLKNNRSAAGMVA